jgi:hypothetical protein
VSPPPSSVLLPTTAAILVWLHPDIGPSSERSCRLERSCGSAAGRNQGCARGQPPPLVCFLQPPHQQSIRQEGEKDSTPGVPRKKSKARASSRHRRRSESIRQEGRRRGARGWRREGTRRRWGLG